MSNLLVYAGTGRKLGLPLTMGADIKAVQVAYRIKSKNKTFIFGMMPLLRELVGHISMDSIDQTYIPYSRRRPFSDESWEELADLSGGSIPVNIYMAEEGDFLEDDELALIVETTDERFAWIAHHFDTVIFPHLNRIVEMGEKLLSLRIAVRQAVIDYSDREATDLCKLFLIDPVGGMTNSDMQLFGAMFKVISPLESSPIAVKYIADHYSPTTMHPSAVMSADIESPIGVEIGERLAYLLSMTRDRHLNLYIKSENDEEAAEQLTRFKDIVEDRNAPLVICLEDGDVLERAKFWMKSFEELVGLEQNSLGLEYPEKQFGIAIRVEDEAGVSRVSDEMAKAGYTIDGFSFLINPDICAHTSDATVKKSFSYKVTDWDDNYVQHRLPLFHEVGTTGVGIGLNEVITRVLHQLEESMPHETEDDDPVPGRYSGWWVKKVVTGVSDL